MEGTLRCLQDLKIPDLILPVFGLILFWKLAGCLKSKREKKFLSRFQFSSTPAPDQLSSRFLQLPAEIRNLIYICVVTEPNGIRYVEIGEGRRGKFLAEDVIVDQRPVQVRIANPLLQVCRQLRYETALLEIQQNDIYFEPSSQYRPAELFTRFLRRYPGVHHQLRKIVISPSFFPIPGRVCFEDWIEMYALVGFCLRNPSVVVQWRWAMFNQERHFFIRDALFVAVKVRCDLSFVQKVAGGNRDLEHFFLETLGIKGFYVQKQRLGNTSTYPKNLRVFPKEKSFDEDKFRAKMRDVPARIGFHSRADDLLAQWIPLAREVYANGV